MTEEVTVAGTFVDGERIDLDAFQSAVKAIDPTEHHDLHKNAKEELLLMTNQDTTNAASDSKTSAKSANGVDPTNRSLLSVIFLGILAGLQLIDPAVANTALVPAARDLGMQGSAFALASKVSPRSL